MTNNPHGPAHQPDPAGSTQMFRAFVDEGAPQRQPAPAASGPRVGLIVGVVAALAIIAGVAWLAMS
ncbi:MULTISPECIES: hypothetical protein [Streptomyces]|uniref:hypothetical protein n=1 Tax=Streptomyces TaxID=1883 RepID=UPI001D13DB0E|nr:MULTISPECIES: hypothetical protein [Streptomyces]MCC3652706.1 hypothetical protein [Streptomyces sp. S07_1.15]WSQ72641.1 hypothetical protein OG463_15185 [Streptomyces xinghaiensis]